MSASVDCESDDSVRFRPASTGNAHARRPRPRIAGPIRRAGLATACIVTTLLVGAVDAAETATTQPAQEAATATATTQPASTSAPAVTTAPAVEEEAVLKPRFEAHVPSLQKLLADARRSHAGVIAKDLGGMLMEMSSTSAEGVDVQEAAALLDQVKEWPDSAIDFVTYAPDSQGRPRWAARVRWPIADLHTRVAALLEAEAAKTLLEDVALEPLPDGKYKVALPEATLAYLIPLDGQQSSLASHEDIEFPADAFTGTDETQGDAPPLLVCRLNLKGTEKDSGGTFFSSFAAVTDVVYVARVTKAGEWAEAVHVHWPPVVGLGAKAIFNRVKKSFFVPGIAFGSFVTSSPAAAGMLEGMAGFGPQMMMDSPGQFEMVGEIKTGPIAARTGPDVCVTLLPGTGFFPAPEAIIQTRARRADAMLEDIRDETEKINKLYRDREQPGPWHEVEVKDRPVFWKAGGSGYSGYAMPVNYRSVIFFTKETDNKGRECDYLVIAYTSTWPEDIVRRWVEFPRSKSYVRMPTVQKPHAQAWINWKQTYTWLQPWFNFGLGAMIRQTVLPDPDEIEAKLTDGFLTLNVKYSGLSVEHQGPIPGGVFAVPTLLAMSFEEDRSGGSDLARERQACRQLKVLHHHATLFKKDFGRWPAEVAELDGYVDFAGNPGLLTVQQSAQKSRSEFFKGLFGVDDDDEEEDEESDESEDQDDESEIDDDIYVIEWRPDSWRLGFVADTFEHLEELYIDHNGEIHRTEKKRD